MIVWFKNQHKKLRTQNEYTRISKRGSILWVSLQVWMYIILLIQLFAKDKRARSQDLSSSRIWRMCKRYNFSLLSFCVFGRNGTKAITNKCVWLLNKYIEPFHDKKYIITTVLNLWLVCVYKSDSQFPNFKRIRWINCLNSRRSSCQFSSDDKNFSVRMWFGCDIGLCNFVMAFLKIGILFLIFKIYLPAQTFHMFYKFCKLHSGTASGFTRKTFPSNVQQAEVTAIVAFHSGIENWKNWLEVKKNNPIRIKFIT